MKINCVQALCTEIYTYKMQSCRLCLVLEWIGTCQRIRKGVCITTHLLKQHEDFHLEVPGFINIKDSYME